MEATLMQEKLLTVREVAERLRVSVVTVKRWLYRGELKGVKAGRQWRVKESEIERFLERRNS